MHRTKISPLPLLKNAIANAKPDLLVLFHIGNSVLYSLFCWPPNGKIPTRFSEANLRQIELKRSLFRELKAAALWWVTYDRVHKPSSQTNGASPLITIFKPSYLKILN